MTERLTKFFVLCFLLNVIVQACDPPCLYFSAGNTIKSIELSSAKITSNITVSQAGRAIAIAVDVEDKFLYWSDKLNRTIKRIDLQSGKIESVISEVGDCEGIAIEWVNKYIYWTDKENNRIEMARVDGSERKLLFDNDVENPRGITVDSVHGYIFWTDWGSNPKIERATLAGQGRTTIIASSSTHMLKYPNDIIVDYKDSKIYWVDAGLDVVGKGDLDGRKIQQSEVIRNSHLFAVALHNNTIFLSDLETNAKSIRLLDKESLKEFGKYTSSVIGSRDLMGITVLQGSRQPPVTSSCGHGNGRCSHLCFIVPGGYRCGCPDSTALREDGYSCQEANFTNCRNHPCRNGGTCYFNFAKLSDECNCRKYYVGKDCGLYLGNGAVRITLEMKVKEWDEEKFKQAIVKGLRDYCMGNACSLRNKRNAKTFCHSFLNSSTFNATQVTIIGQPTESFSNHTKVDFAVILRPESSSKPKIVVNTTLEYVVQESANSISKHLGGYKTVFVNNLRPSSDLDVRCINETDGDGQVNVTNDDDQIEKGEKDKRNALLLGTTISSGIVVLAIVLVVVAVWYRRKQDRECNQQMHVEIERDENNEVLVIHNDLDRRDSQRLEEGDEEMRAPPVLLNKQNFNSTEVLSRRERFDGGVENCDIQQRENCEGYVNQTFREEDSQQPVGVYEDMSSPQELSIPQETFNVELGRRNVEGNQQRNSNDEQDCEVYENESAGETNQESTGIYEEIEVSQASSIPQETSNGALPAPSLPATPHNADQGDASRNHDNQMCMLLDGPETGRQAVEHDDGDCPSTYANAVQCTEDLQETNLHKL